MTKLLWLLTVVLFSFFTHVEALECYNCYVNLGFSKRMPYRKGAEFVPCNEKNMADSNTWECPVQNSKCVHQELEFDGTESRVAWRTCSNGLADPCNQDGLLPGVKLISCQTCSTDKCNLMVEKENGKIYTFHINANVSLFLRQ